MKIDAQHPALNLMGPTMRRCFCIVAERGEAAAFGVSETMQQDPENVRYHLRNLCEAGLVTWRLGLAGPLERCGKAVQLFQLSPAGASLFDWHDPDDA